MATYFQNCIISGVVSGMLVGNCFDSVEAFMQFFGIWLTGVVMAMATNWVNSRL